MVQNLDSVLIFQFLLRVDFGGAQHLQLSELASDAMLEVAGSIQAVDAERKQWDLLLDAKSPHFAQRSVRVRVRSGDFAIYPLGAKVQGQLQAKGDAFLLSAVWPNGANEQGIVHSVNHQLRMDTTARGHYPFRAIGEYLPAFALYNQRGLVTQSSNLQGGYVVMNFIFTRCGGAYVSVIHPKDAHAGGAAFGSSDLPVRLLSVTLIQNTIRPGSLKSMRVPTNFPRAYRLLSGPSSSQRLEGAVSVLAKADDKLIINHTMMVIVADPLGKISYQVPGSAWSPKPFSSIFNNMPPLKMPKSTRNFVLITFFCGPVRFVRSLPTQSCELAYYGDYLNPDGSLGFCGDEEVHFFDLDQLQYPFSVHLQQDVSLKAGTKQSLRMQFTGPDGQPVRPEDLIVSHTERLHLLAVSEDLSDYQHLHPQATGVPGEYRFDWQPLRAGDYRLYFDFIVQASLRRALVDTQVTVAGRSQSDPAAQTRAVNLQAQTEQLPSSCKPIVLNFGPMRRFISI